MKNKRVPILAFALIAFTSVITYGSQTNFFHTSLDLLSALFGQDNSNEIPDEVLYDNLFRIANSLTLRAELPESTPDKSAGLLNYFKDRANLTDKENEVLQKTALEYIRDVTPIDRQARTIIDGIRREISNGNMPKNQPPPELEFLQRQRNDMALLYRDSLRDSLGANGFAKFEQFINGYFLAHFQRTPASSIELEQ